jgi:hypothetical protein
MATLHSVLRSLRTDNKSRRDHFDVFREFLDHLDRATKRRKAAARKTASKKKRL